MEEEMFTLHNVMPVELAIQREIEYRRKMELLKNQHLSNLKPLQVHPPSQVGLKRKMPSRNFQGFHILQPSSSCGAFQNRSTGLVCKICEMTFANVDHLKQHSETSRHKGNVLQLKKRGENVSTPFLCELCNSSCSSGTVMEQHLTGTKHASVFQEFKSAKKSRTQEAFAAN